MTLERNIEYEFGMRESLQGKEIFTDIQLNKLDYTNSNFERIEFNEKLLEMLCESINIKHYRGFIESLRESLQSHLRAVIMKDGVFAAGDGNIPLSVEDINELKNRTEKITKSRNTDIDDLLNTISERRCLNSYHIKSIREKISRRYDWTQPLLDIVQRRSFFHLRDYFECIQELPTGLRDSLENPFTRNTTVKILENNSQIPAMTVIDNKIFTASHPQSCVNVYLLSTLKAIL